MSLTVTNLVTAASTASGASLVSGASVTAAVGDWLYVACSADNTGTDGAMID